MEVSQKSFSRKKPDQLVYLELGSGNGGMLLSISEDGFRFRAVSALRPNGLMPFAFSFDGSHRLQGIGEVEWLEDDGKSGGMRCVEVSPDSRSALGQWLALDSRHAHSSREVTPTAAAPLDTMEKIREELRRGYSSPSDAKPQRRDAQAEPPAVAPAKRQEKPETESRLHQPRAESTADPERLERAVPASSSAEPKHPATDSDGITASKTVWEHHTAEQTPVQAERPGSDRNRAPEPPPFSPPPFSQRAESGSRAPLENASSAFLKNTAPAPPAAPVRPTRIPPPGAPTTTDLPQSIADAHAATEALRRPFRTESSPGRSARPYIPPVDESFEAAWERAKLTAPPESPHLSRAAAGSIIGIALAVILGALAFNFRQDIGELIIDVGRRVSGENHAAAPATRPADNPQTQNPSEPAASDRSLAQSKPENAAETPSLPAQTAGKANGSADPRGTDSTTSHDTPAGATHEAAFSATHNTTANPRSTPTRGATNPSSTGAAGSATSQSPAVSTVNPVIGSEPGSGQDEFNAARELLRGDHRQRDLSRAVDLLWAGVRKGYVPAEVTLADLYRRGDGVEKNCDQAQVLLVAASKKGSPEARHLLELMAEEGCTE